MGSLCTGILGAELALARMGLEPDLRWYSEIDPHACKLLADKTDAPNLGDLKLIEWERVEPVDILCAGYPCQPFSHAGKRKGTDDPRHLWPWIECALRVLRPRYALFENVAAHLGLGFVHPVTETVYAATLSPCGLYRYRLSRTWGTGDRMAWIMLNPSTADSEVDDHTIRRCMGFARREGYDGIEVLNLYALRATKPKHLLDHPDPEGPGNFAAWDEVMSDHRIGMFVAAWGAGVDMPNLAPARMIPWLHASTSPRCLGTTAAGHPRHPLYVKADQPLVGYNFAPTDPQEDR